MLFEQASRVKLRFATTRGSLNVEDLWDLPLTEGGILDQLAVGLEAALGEEPKKSFVVKKRDSNEELELKFDIVKHIIKVKKAEKKTSRNEAADRESDEIILGLIKEQENDDLKKMPIKDLKKLLSKNKK